MLGLIERLYAAVQAPELWEIVLGAIAGHLGGESIALFATNTGTHTPELLTLHEMPASSWQQFVSYYAAINPIMQRCEQRLDPKTTWFSHHVCTDRELEGTEFYTDFFRPNRMHHSVGMRLGSGGAAIANLSCQRPSNAGAFGEGADVILQTLRPHLQQALSLRAHLDSMGAQRLGLEVALEAYGHAALGLDGSGRVSVCSSRAHWLLDGTFKIKLKQGRLCCSEPAAHSRLQKLIDDAILQQLPAAHGSMNYAMKLDATAADGLDRELRITVLPYRCKLPGQSAALAALLFLSDSVGETASRDEVLTGLYGLTPTEARIADLLVTGLDVAEVALTLRLTRETARFYTKRILAKTGTRRQSELLRLILSFPPTKLPSGR